MPEVWLRGPVPGYEPLILPAAHSLLQVKEDIEALTDSVRPLDLWARPGGAASIGFHVRHIGASLDRLLTYARGEMLTADQMNALASEGDDTGSLQEVAAIAIASIDRALAQLRATPADMFFAERKVGRAGLPSTTIGLIFHAAEHAGRHAGQAVTTARILNGLRSG